MAYFETLSDAATVPDILALDPASGIALTQLTEQVMRGPSSLSEGERELIAAYVSGLNQCAYCYGVHKACAAAYGFDKAPMQTWLEDLPGAGFAPRLLVLLQTARVLTLEPSGMNEALARDVYDAGWDERALHGVIAVTGLFNLYNRFLEGHGVHGNEAMYKERGRMLKQHGYAPLIRMLERHLEQFPKNGGRFPDQNCGKTNR